MDEVVDLVCVTQTWVDKLWGPGPVPVGKSMIKSWMGFALLWIELALFNHQIEGHISMVTQISI